MKPLKVLLLGSGGREHALAWKLSQSPLLSRLWAARGSEAIAEFAEPVELDPADGPAVAAWAAKAKVHLVISGSEAPLAAGVGDAVRKAKIAFFGPGKDAAQLESSKSFAKDFMRRHRIPTAPYEVFAEAWKARSAVEAMRPPVVIKADGLAGGKGVRVCADTNAALGTVTEYMERGALGEAGRTVVVERCLQGPELSVMGLLDGKSYRLLPTARDHKRLLDGDRGPNTGGMGAFAPVPLAPELERLIREAIFDRALAGLRADKLDYRGVLYAGLMLTSEGPKVLEFNCRFGDPETQAVLPLLDSDLLELAWSCARGRIGNLGVRAHPGASVCVILASEGYPDRPVADRTISGLPPANQELMVFHGGTAKAGSGWVTKGGRALGVSALGGDLPGARQRAYAAADRIRFEGMQYRKDIAAPAATAAVGKQ